jgi:hypothetical protein
LRQGREQRLLDGILAGVEVAVASDERAQDLRRERAKERFREDLGRVRDRQSSPL